MVQEGAQGVDRVRVEPLMQPHICRMQRELPPPQVEGTVMAVKTDGCDELLALLTVFWIALCAELHEELLVVCAGLLMAHCAPACAAFTTSV